ncbi:hypothetical protein [Lyngbya confervoides]|uniref:Uncharacterized protein n=1 Tax=Lyngbya confervoides BDU141951 TaxID=1574623 RepID=A0ABD4T8V9_9CYAN|nr:hypothetical protein [Lyngbya confervoides]MCM1984755.1 hypothetical protein [Lyngbya confervoides BDU141951]
MSFTPAVLDALKQLLTLGEVSQAKLADLPTGTTLGLWTPSADQQRAVATPALVRLLRTLPTSAEAIAAILSCEPEIRQAWQRIASARLQELGQQRDAAGLCDAISALGFCATKLLETLPQGNLDATPFAAFERNLFEVPAEQAIATPKLYRVLGATAALVEGRQGKPGTPLPNVDPLNPAQNWLKGRLMQPPRAEMDGNAPQKQWRTTSILSGSWADYTPPDTEERPELAEMYWVLARPWCFLLAQIVFTQEAWAAERISGELALELDPSNGSLAYRPPQISVVITSPEGNEILCGSLGELLLRVLQQLGVELLTPSVEGIDAQLAPVIEVLIQRQVWQFNPGAGGYRPHYTIHPIFSDTCYRALGSKYFNRLASPVTATIRSTSEQWAKERQMTAHPPQAPRFAMTS